MAPSLFIAILDISSHKFFASYSFLRVHSFCYARKHISIGRGMDIDNNWIIEKFIQFDEPYLSELGFRLVTTVLFAGTRMQEHHSKLLRMPIIYLILSATSFIEGRLRLWSLKHDRAKKSQRLHRLQSTSLVSMPSSCTAPVSYLPLVCWNR